MGDVHPCLTMLAMVPLGVVIGVSAAALWEYLDRRS